MKKIFYALPLLTAFIFLQSCQKNQDHGSRLITIDTTLSAGTVYELNLQPYGDKDDIAAIRKQATQFTTSEIINTAGTFAPVYHYASDAMAKTAVSDQVILAITEGNRGNGACRHPNDSTLITINFQVK